MNKPLVKTNVAVKTIEDDIILSSEDDTTNMKKSSDKPSFGYIGIKEEEISSHISKEKITVKINSRKSNEPFQSPIKSKNEKNSIYHNNMKGEYINRKRYRFPNKRDQGYSHRNKNEYGENNIQAAKKLKKKISR